MRVIYLDVLIVLNLYVTFFLLKASCCAVHIKAKNSRVIAASAAGGLSSLVIMLPGLGFAANVIIKLLIGAGIVFLAFGFRSKGKFLKNTLVFTVMNLLFAGLMLALWLFAAPVGMVYNNGYAYFDISLVVIIVSTALAYGLLRLIRYFLDSRTVSDKKYEIRITNKGKTVTLDGFADSGNSLTDFFTGLPVIICDYEKAAEITPGGVEQLLNEKTLPDFPEKGLRIIPFSTISDCGTVVAFKPEEITVITENGEKQTNALIGFSRTGKQSHQAIFNPKILI